jgi:serine/threonine protein kinase
MMPVFDGPLLHGRYRLGPRLGAGGQGRTYLARDETASFERLVAVKELRLSFEGGWKKYDLFQREVRVLKELDHQGIPRYLDEFEGETPGVFHLVMERAPGETLAGARLSERELGDLMVRILEILAYLHGRSPPVIHRDIKPANVLRAPDGVVSLVDFGSVRDLVRDGGSTVTGTFGYMAPEQLHGEATPATDLYGLGMTIVAVAGGVEPEHVPRKGLRLKLKQHLPSLSPDLRELLERMTEADPQRRPASAREVLDLLRPEGRPALEVAVAGDEAESEPLDPTLPRWLRILIRLALFGAGTAGYAAMVVADYIIVPVAFTLVRAFSRPENRPKVAAAHDSTRAALREGRAGFARMQKRALRGLETDRRALPPSRR